MAFLLSKADLLVYEVDSPFYIKGNNGVWYFTEKGYQADKKLYEVHSELQADLVIFFVHSEYKADWRKEEKKHLMEKDK